MQNLMAKNKAKPAKAKGSKIHNIMACADMPVLCSLIDGSLEFVI